MKLPTLTDILVNPTDERGNFSQNFLKKATKSKDTSKKWLSNLFGKSQQKTGIAGGPSKLGSAFGQKDPQRTSIGSGSSARLKVKDSIADIVAKQYLFMQKTYEAQQQEDELNVAFRKEQLEEDERRHKKLTDELIKFKKTAIPEKEKELTKEEEKDDGSWIQKMIGGIKSAFVSTLKGLISVIMAPIKLLWSVVSSLVGQISTMLAALAGTIMGVIASNITAIFALIVPHAYKLITSIVGGIIKMIEQGIERVINGPEDKKMGTIEKAIRGFLSRALLTPFGAVAATLLGTAAAAQTYSNAKDEMMSGDEYKELTDRHTDELRKMVPEDRQMTPEEEKAYRKRQNEQNIEAAGVKKNFEENTLIPKMTKDGWTAERDKNGKLDFKKGDESAGLTDLYKAFEGDNYLQKIIMKQFSGVSETFEGFAERKKNEVINKMKTAVKDEADKIMKPIEKSFGEAGNKFDEMQTNIKAQLDSNGKGLDQGKLDFDKGYNYARSGGGSTAVSNTNNSVNQTPKNVHTQPMRVKHDIPGTLEPVF